MSEMSYGLRVADAVTELFHHLERCEKCGRVATKRFPEKIPGLPIGRWNRACDKCATVHHEDIKAAPAIRKLERLVLEANERPSVRALTIPPPK